MFGGPGLGKVHISRQTSAAKGHMGVRPLFLVVYPH
jgi:hypothetical protein